MVNTIIRQTIAQFHGGIFPFVWYIYFSSNSNGTHKDYLFQWDIVENPHAIIDIFVVSFIRIIQTRKYFFSVCRYTIFFYSVDTIMLSKIEMCGAMRWFQDENFFISLIRWRDRSRVFDVVDIWSVEILRCKLFFGVVEMLKVRLAIVDKSKNINKLDFGLRFFFVACTISKFLSQVINSFINMSGFFVSNNFFFPCLQFS